MHQGVARLIISQWPMQQLSERRVSNCFYYCSSAYSALAYLRIAASPSLEGCGRVAAGMIPRSLLFLRSAAEFFRCVQPSEVRIEWSHFERNLLSLRH